MMNALIEGAERNAQRQTRQYLLGLSDGFLKEMGISRELLKQGPDAWPWRLDEAPRGDLKLSAGANKVKAGSDARPAAIDRARHETGDKLAA